MTLTSIFYLTELLLQIRAMGNQHYYVVSLVSTWTSPPPPSSPSPPSSAQSSPTLYLLAWLKLHLKCRTNTWLAFLLNGVNWCHRLILKKKKKELGYSLERSLSMGCSRIRRKTLRCAVFPWKCKHIRFILQRFLQDRVSTRDWNRLRSSWLNA